MTPMNTMGTPMPAASVTASYTSSPGTTSAVNSSAGVVRVVATTDCFIEIGLSPTAAANTGCYLPAFTPEYFACPQGSKVSAIQVSSGGSIYVTPFA